MIKFLILLLIAFPVYSSVRIELSADVSVVNQGELTEVALKIHSDLNTSLELQKLKGTSFGGVIYFYEISPLLRKEGSPTLYADARIIFVKVPEGTTIKSSFEGRSMEMELIDLEVRPTEAAQNYQFGNFEIPLTSRFVAGVVIILVVLILSLLLALPLLRKIQDKRRHKIMLRKLKSEVLECKAYDDVVELWKAKHLYLETFPHIKEPFHRLEEVLYKYQFKQFQSQQEKQEVIESYRKFVASVEGGFIGI